MLNLWEEQSAKALALADAVRELAARPIESEDEAEKIGRALQAVAADISVAGASVIRLNQHPAMERGATFGHRAEA